MIRSRLPLFLSVAALLTMATDCASAIRDPRASARSSDRPLDQPLSPSELQKRWWTWVAGSSEATNPVADDTGKYCAPSQPGDIWFLADTFGEKLHRKCTVPAGLRLAGPALSMIEHSSQDCAKSLRGAKGEAILDGVKKPVDLIEPVTSRSSRWPTTRSSRPRAAGCPRTDAGCGLQPEPLKPGRHTLVLRGRSGDFSTEANYEFTVLADHPEALRMPPLPVPRGRSRR